MSINANELRIGNWFNEFGIPTQADGRFIDRLQNIQLRGKVAIDVTPIPLTESILEKAGFVEKNLSYYKGDIELYFQRAYRKFYFKFGYKENEKSAILISHLHQLQNLIHSLTRKELDINL